jgi:hypothetical protein
MNKTLSWYLMTYLAFGIGLYALGNARVPAIRQDFVAEMIAQASAAGTLLHFWREAWSSSLALCNSMLPPE